MSTTRGSFLRSSVTHVAVAFLAMGSWAAFANRAHPMPAPLYAGMIQGAISGCITLFLKRAIETLASRLDGLAALLVPPVAAFIVSASLLTAIHVASGTPEIVATIALPLCVSTGYAALYSFALWRARNVRS
jgi:fructose-specific phosphotransferase system IIC component